MTIFMIMTRIIIEEECAVEYCSFGEFIEGKKIKWIEIENYIFKNLENRLTAWTGFNQTVWKKESF